MVWKTKIKEIYHYKYGEKYLTDKKTMQNLRLCPYVVDGNGIRALKRIPAKRITSIEHMLVLTRKASRDCS